VAQSQPADTTDKSVPQVFTELWEMIKAYARQETIDPLKGVGRYIGFGFIGAVLAATGIILLLLSLLRALQTEGITGTTFHGSWSWAPYVITLLVAVALAILAGSRIRKH